MQSYLHRPISIFWMSRDYKYNIFSVSGTFRGTFEVAVKTLKSDRDSGNGSDDGSSSAGGSSSNRESPRAAKARKEFHSETQILMQLHHPHLVQVKQYLYKIISSSMLMTMFILHYSTGNYRYR